MTGMSQTNFRSILAVITDPFSADQPAARKAAALARRSKARLILLNAFMFPQPVSDAPMDSPEQIIRSAVRQRRERILKMAASWRRQGVKVKVVVEWDYPAHDAIIRVVQRERADLVVAHSHRHGRIARWVLANTDWELIRHCPCPVWFVRRAELPRSPKLLVAVDPFHAHAKPTGLDDRLLTAANGLAHVLGATVDVVHAYHAPLVAATGTITEPFRMPSAAYAARDGVERAKGMVCRLAERFDVDPDHCHLIEGDPSIVLARFASRQDADVLVMGAVSRSVVTRAAIGNTAERVIDGVDCDVLVVKPRGFKTSVPKVRRR